MNTQMTPQDALQIVDQACATFTGNRQDHTTLLEAIKVLKEVVDSQEKPKKSKK